MMIPAFRLYNLQTKLVAQRYFSSTLKMTLMDKFNRVDAVKDPATNNFSMKINLMQPAKLSFSQETTLNYFKETLLASGAH